MKKVALMLVLAVGLTAQAWAQDTDTISVSVSLASVISVQVAPSSWNIGALASLPATVGPQSATATVGNTTTALDIMASHGTGGWQLSPAVDKDKFKVTVADPALTLSTSYQALDAGLAPYDNKVFALTYASPTSDSIGAGVDQGFTITVKASAP